MNRSCYALVDYLKDPISLCLRKSQNYLKHFNVNLISRNMASEGALFQMTHVLCQSVESHLLDRVLALKLEM